MGSIPVIGSYKIMRSRVRSNIRKQNRKTIIGIIVIILVFIFFGSNLLIGYGVLLDKISGEKKIETNSLQDVDYIAPPVLNPTTEAVNTEKINITGFSAGSKEIELYLNNKLIEKIKIEDDSSFSFKNLILKPGNNNIKAKAIDGKKESGFSNIISIIYRNEPPTIEIEKPKDGEIFKKDDGPIIVEGKIEPEFKVTVNDILAIVDDEGRFLTRLSLESGDNNIRVEVTDDAGSKTTKEIKVKGE